MTRPIVFVVALLMLIGAAFLLPVAEWLQLLFQWVEENRSIAWIVFILVYVVACVLMLPGSLITLAAGFLFGLGYGYLIVAVGSVVGASCAFLVGRFFARDWVASQLESMPRFASLDRAIAQKGALVVLLTRLSPLFPFNLLNYALGLTNVNFWTYVCVSWLGMIPGTLLYVYLGSVASNLTSLLNGDLAQSQYGAWLFYAGLAATLVLTIFITRLASQALNNQLDNAS